MLFNTSITTFYFTLTNSKTSFELWFYDRAFVRMINYFLAENFLGTQSPELPSSELSDSSIGSLGADSLQLLPGSAWDLDILNDIAIGATLAGGSWELHGAGREAGHPSLAWGPPQRSKPCGRGHWRQLQ